MRVHHIERHLHRIESKFMNRGGLQHFQMNSRIFMSRKPNEANLSALFGILHRVHRSALKDASRVLEPDDLMKLHQIDMIRLQTRE